jgi:oxygen-independent coproporphyrinogen-3 oxidase
VAGKDHLADSYLKALAIEFETIPDKPLIKTLFLGGGTPTQLSASHLDQLITLTENTFEFDAEIEFSTEANPIGFTPEKLGLLKNAGCNRISLGVQSFDPAVLKTLERDHQLVDIKRCIDMVQSRIENLSLDLIFAVPGQTLALWNETLQVAIEFQPKHLSTYGLTFEKGTSFWSRRERGTLHQVGDDLERSMYALAMSMLEAVHFEQYEISSFAKPGYRCIHNQVYWNGAPYWGFGPGAASFINKHRLLNHRSVTTWIKKTLAGESAVMEDEVLTPEDRARELLVLSMRRIAGVDSAEFEDRSGFDIKSLAENQISKLSQRGLVESTATGYRLTIEGRFLADTVAGELLTAD